jgi:hypothetical protein
VTSAYKEKGFGIEALAVREYALGVGGFILISSQQIVEPFMTSGLQKPLIVVEQHLFPLVVAINNQYKI